MQIVPEDTLRCTILSKPMIALYRDERGFAMTKGLCIAIMVSGLLMAFCSSGLADITVDFTFTPHPAIANQAITFTAVVGGLRAEDTPAYRWDFGDGASDTGQSVTHAFAIEREYRVTLTVTLLGREWTRTRTVSVVHPTVDFSWSTTAPRTQDTVRFAGQATPTAGILSWDWKVDDRGVGTGQNLPHTFAKAGTYRVTLTVTYETNAVVSISHSIDVTSAPPTAAFTFTPANPRIGEAVKFNAKDSNDPDGEIVSYEWDFPDVPGRVNATGIEVSHAFTQAGTQRVTLTVTDNDGAVGVITRVVPVETIPPVAAFTFKPAEPDAGQVITFDGRGSADEDGEIILWEWDFHEDRTTDLTGSVVTYSFPMPGAYPVRLTVTDDDGAISVITLVVPVEVAGVGPVNQLPKADFTFAPAEPPNVSMNEVVTFKAVGSTDDDGTIDAYEWDFDNDGVYDATGKTAPHVFHSGGSQIVTLRVTDNAGGRGFKTSVVSVDFVRPIADFTTTPDEPVIGAVVTFYGGASSDADGHIDFYAWDFDGDGVVDATGMSVNHAFTTGGSHPVTLTVTDNDGVPDSTTRTVFVRINILPTAGFTYLPESPTIADTITFTDTSADADGTIVAWQWDFGDGTTRTVQNPTHTYAAAGTHIVRLTVTDNDGASSSVTENVIVAALVNVPPVANFRFAPTLPQVDRAVQFTSLGTDVDGTVTGWEWDFGDGATSTVRNPAHTYTSVGTYTVTLIVIDDNGARSAAVTRQITIAQAGEYIVTFSYPNPASTHARIVYFHPAGTTDLMLRIFNLVGWLVYQTDLTVGASPYIWDLMSNDGEDLPNGLYFFQITARDDDGRTIRSQVFRLLIQR